MRREVICLITNIGLTLVNNFQKWVQWRKSSFQPLLRMTGENHCQLMFIVTKFLFYYQVWVKLAEVDTSKRREILPVERTKNIYLVCG